MKVETALPIGKVDPGLREVATRLDLASVPAAAREVEDLGYDGMVNGEIKNDAFLPLALAATSTRRITLTTAVAIAFPRSPMVTAMIAWDLASLSKGRFILGLGPQVKGHIERRFSTPWAPPVPRLREYILSLRAIWECWQHGAPLDVQGTYYQFSLMVPLFNPGPISHPEIPIHVAAVNPGMCRLAGQLCEGVRPHPITTARYMKEVMLPAVDAGAKKAGRTLKGFQVVISPLIAAAPTRAGLEERIRDVRARIAFYASTRTYGRVFEHEGWGALTAALHELSVQKRWDEMPGRITDEVLHEIAIVGTYDEVARMITKRYGAIATGIEFGLPLRSPSDRDALRRAVSELRGSP